MFEVTTKNLYDRKKGRDGKIVYDGDFSGKQTSWRTLDSLRENLVLRHRCDIYWSLLRAENSNTRDTWRDSGWVNRRVAFIDITTWWTSKRISLSIVLNGLWTTAVTTLNSLTSLLIRPLFNVLRCFERNIRRIELTAKCKEAVKNGQKFGVPMQLGRWPRKRTWTLSRWGISRNLSSWQTIQRI